MNGFGSSSGTNKAQYDKGTTNMKKTQNKNIKPQGRTPSRLSILLGDEYPSVDYLRTGEAYKNAKVSFDSHDIAKALQKFCGQRHESLRESIVCSTLHLKDLSPQTVKHGKNVFNFEDITSTRARDPENALSLEAAAGFIWPAEERVFHSHIGEEVVFVLDGKLRYRDILGNNLVVESGDVLRYRSELFHEVSSISEIPVAVIVIWWGPSFRGSVLGAKQSGPSYKPETWARAEHIPAYQQELRINESIREHDLKGARKFCLGIPSMISCKLDAMGISHESLAKIIEYTPRYINELLNGFLEPSLDVLCKISQHLGFPSDHLIWRADDHEAWIQSLASKKYRRGDKFDSSVISVRYLEIGVSANKFEYPITQQKSDRIFIVLKGGLNLQQADLYKQESKDIAATAELNEAIYLRGGHDCVLFPLRQKAELLEVSVTDHAKELEDRLTKKKL